jgi:protein involved in polysaccharide export with SLBB domain
VLGSVGKPGRYPLAAGMTILDLLAESGGPTGTAMDSRIVVVNLSCCGNEARTFDLPRFARTGDFAMLPLVRPGDTIYVPNQQQSDWRFFFDNLRDVVTAVSILAFLKVL